MINVLLIEDDLDLAQTVMDYLQLEGISCDHASNGSAGLNLLQQADYDVLLLDLNLPRIDGLTICERLRAKGSDVPVLMLTARDQLADKQAGFAAGTDDYLVKPFELKELVLRIQALSRRRSGQIRILQCGDLQMNVQQHHIKRGSTNLHLSPIGWQILELLLRETPNVVSRRRIEMTIWGEATPDSDSLKVHLHHLRKMVDGPFEKALIHTIPGVGVAIRTDNEDQD